MKSIDFKSLLIGILGTALVMVLMGLALIKAIWRDSLRMRQGLVASEVVLTAAE